MKSLFVLVGGGCFKEAVGHFPVFRYSTWAKEKWTNPSMGVRHLNGSKLQGHTYMKKRTPGSEKIALSRKEELVRSQCPDTQDGEEKAESRPSVLVRKSKQSSCPLGSPVTSCHVQEGMEAGTFLRVSRT